MGSTIKDKLTGNCESCEERKQAMIKRWQETKRKIQEAWEKRNKLD